MKKRAYDLDERLLEYSVQVRCGSWQRGISLKELRETQRWLRLIEQAALIDCPTLLGSTQKETEELIKIFVASIKTAERKKPERDQSN